MRYPCFDDIEVSRDWAFENVRSTEQWTHGYHRYPAKFLPNVVKKIIEDHKLKDCVVADFFVLPSFPFSDDTCNKSAVIDFKTAFSVRLKSDYESKRTGYKLNAPYIHQLRQRYVSFFGKYGVPATPDTLRVYNLK